ncbi:hypothetical protein K490DRAFT_31641 [Saccharata proteae CBS 121410]|uniref:Cora-domain-containing protein n=1 Tax=Saccharata proteae CBS 121410 TaxID=1314787 RepID=A0A9P4I237_9PEZI|nr:hypothetical protein K490DRAFT_31641 [Saccharata proteae CBS 121410]
MSSSATQELLRQLEEQRTAFLALEERVHEALRLEAASKPDSPPPSQTPGSPVTQTGARQSAISIVEPTKKSSTPLPSLFHSSTVSVDSDSEDDETYYVQTPLPAKAVDHEDLRTHLRTHKWDEHGQTILESVVTDDGRLVNPVLFPDHGQAEDNAHISHFQVFDVGPDGAPLPVEIDPERVVSKAVAFWDMIKEINAEKEKRTAVGRIIVAQEPCPISFGALHLAKNDCLDMDEIFRHLVDTSFSSSHLPLTRCSATVALALHGDPVKRIRNPARRSKVPHGNIYDPWSPWVVLNIQCYPDWKSSTDAHDSTKHYVNGPEAFLCTVLTEFRDAQSRYEEIERQVTKLVTPPLDFLFDNEQRDRRLFEDDNFTYTRGYFWAAQTLSTVNDSIKAMIDAYEHTFTDDVWEGRHKTLWPLLDPEHPRNDHYRRKLFSLRRDFEREIKKLRQQIKENNDRRHEIASLRDQLFSGTSVLESRKSVELSEMTILQGHNIKLLTLVNIFFLPLTFVTSVFGMTNMPTDRHYWPFAIVMVTVCIPFFLLVGSLNTTKGYEFWKAQVLKVIRPMGHVKKTIKDRKKKEGADDDSESDEKPKKTKERSKTSMEVMRRRMTFTQPGSNTNSSLSSIASIPAAKKERHQSNGSSSNLPATVSARTKPQARTSGPGPAPALASSQTLPVQTSPEQDQTGVRFLRSLSRRTQTPYSRTQIV